VQEREDAGRQTRQQLEDRDRADAEQLRRHDAETESLRSELKAARELVATVQQKSGDNGQQQQLLEHQVTELKASLSRLEQVTCEVACMWRVTSNARRAGAGGRWEADSAAA
jgi:hypothetical protein